MCHVFCSSFATARPAELMARLCAALASGHPATWAHSQRVRAHAARIGRELALSADELRRCEDGALLHDFGKLLVPRHELDKPGVLSAAERAHVSEHPRLGFDFLRRFDALEEILPAVLQHHERWDGGGYPAHLGSGGIALEARIVAVADCFDAMTSNRPYRSALSQDQAGRELRAGAGAQFDPMIVDAFLGAQRFATAFGLS